MASESRRTMKDTYIIDPRMATMVQAMREVTTSHRQMTNELLQNGREQVEALEKIKTGWQEFNAALEVYNKVVSLASSVTRFFLDDIDANQFPELAADVDRVSASFGVIVDGIRDAGREFLQATGVIDGMAESFGGLASAIEAYRSVNSGSLRTAQDYMDTLRNTVDELPSFVRGFVQARLPAESLNDEMARGAREADRLAAELRKATRENDYFKNVAAEAADELRREGEAMAFLRNQAELLRKEAEERERMEREAEERRRRAEQRRREEQRTSRQGRIAGGSVRDSALAQILGMGEQQAQRDASELSQYMAAMATQVAQDYANQIKSQLKPGNFGREIGDAMAGGVLDSMTAMTMSLSGLISSSMEEGAQSGVQRMASVFAVLQQGLDLAVGAGLIAESAGGVLGGVIGLFTAVSTLTSFLGAGSGSSSRSGSSRSTRQRALTMLPSELTGAGGAVTNYYNLIAPEFFSEQEAARRFARMQRTAERRREVS